MQQDEEDGIRRGGSPHSDRSMEDFTLHDVEDDEEEQSRAEAGHAPVAAPAATAATAAPQQPPPQSEAPKAELLNGIPKSDEVQ